MSNLTECHNNLVNIASNKGYLLFDDILDAVADFNLSVTQVDALTEQLSSQGFVVYEEAPELNVEHDLQDYSKTNYKAIYSEIIILEPELEPFVNLIRDIPPPQYGETAALTKQLKYNSFARERLILSNLRNVLRIALPISKQYRYSLSDAVSAGVIGLLTAADHYEIGGFSSFQSYSSLWIQQVIHRECSPDWMHYYYPYHIRQNMLKTIIAYEEYSGGIYVSMPEDDFFEQLAKELEITFLQAKEILISIFYQLFGNIELDYRINNDELFLKSVDYSYFSQKYLREVDGCFYSDLIIDEKAEEELFHHTVNSLLKEQLQNVLDTLTSREAEVLKCRYGFDDYINRTLEEVGKIFGVSRERIRQIEAKAFRKLRHPSRSKKLKDYY